MASSGDYLYFRKIHRDVSTELTFTASTDDTVLITATSASHTIYVQRIIGYITTDAAQSIAFQDTAGTPVKIAEITTSPGDETRWDFDFGEEGTPLTVGTNLNMNVSATGLAGHVKVYAYQRITVAMAVGTTNL